MLEIDSPPQGVAPAILGLGAEEGWTGARRSHLRRACLRNLTAYRVVPPKAVRQLAAESVEFFLSADASEQDREADSKHVGNALVAWAMITAKEIQDELGPERQPDFFLKAPDQLGKRVAS